ncbi:MAG: RHS repeat-associated core domain-containing protein [Abditibacteriales bacterium]|nr:RHS repeat-associated core domain-containing protein [Abditibacteriales bacterium]
MTQTTTFDAFGNIESSAGSSGNVDKYAGQWGYRNDGDDGLMHVGARYYDPLVGRFISADTYLGEIIRPQSLNRYNYCEGDPVNYVDPTGHQRKPKEWWDWFWGSAGGAAGTIIGGAIGGAVIGGPTLGFGIKPGMLIGGTIGAGVGALAGLAVGDALWWIGEKVGNLPWGDILKEIGKAGTPGGVPYPPPPPHR